MYVEGQLTTQNIPKKLLFCAPPLPPGLTVVYEMSTSLNLANQDITCTEWNPQ